MIGQGRYIKFADGTLICTLRKQINVEIATSYGAIYIGSYNWTYPHPFKTGEISISGSNRWKNSADFSVSCGSPTTTTAALRIWDTHYRPLDFSEINVIAIGRWK